jgi:hypothetical protein
VTLWAWSPSCTRRLRPRRGDVSHRGSPRHGLRGRLGVRPPLAKGTSLFKHPLGTHLPRAFDVGVVHRRSWLRPRAGPNVGFCYCGAATVRTPTFPAPIATMRVVPRMVPAAIDGGGSERSDRRLMEVVALSAQGAPTNTWTCGEKALSTCSGRGVGRTCRRVATPGRSRRSNDRTRSLAHHGAVCG